MHAVHKMHNHGGENIAASKDTETLYDETTAETDCAKRSASPGDHAKRWQVLMKPGSEPSMGSSWRVATMPIMA